MDDEQANPLESSLVRTLIALSGASVAAAVGVLFFDGLLRWLIIGIAVLDVIVTPYILKMAAEQNQPQSDPTA
jgi:hypothetical protein